MEISVKGRKGDVKVLPRHNVHFILIKVVLKSQQQQMKVNEGEPRGLIVLFFLALRSALDN